MHVIVSRTFINLYTLYQLYFVIIVWLMHNTIGDKDDCIDGIPRGIWTIYRWPTSLLIDQSRPFAPVLLLVLQG